MGRKYGESTFAHMRGLVVTGIHTEVGKTVVAGALSAGLNWPYWKPIQTGHPPDTHIARTWGLSVIEAAYSFEFPGAPLIAAQKEATAISWSLLLSQWETLPKPLIVEGAGGLFVPITPKHFFIDLFQALQCPIVLVVRPYLGAMNHTWLSLRAIAEYKLDFLGVVLCGTTGDPSEAYFRETFAPILLGEIPFYAGGLPEARLLYQRHLAQGIEAALANPPAPLTLQTLHSK